MKLRCLVIGGGWYGCTSALTLAEQGFDVDLCERNRFLLSESSMYNQNRLHQGYHYLRNKRTRDECMRQFHHFKQNYYSSRNFRNYYCVAETDSLMDAGTITSIIEHEGMDYKVQDPPPTFLANVSLVIECSEEMIDVAVNRRQIAAKLDAAGVNVHFNPIWRGVEYDLVVMCTYNGTPPRGIDCPAINVVYELCLSLLFKPNDKFDSAVTVVDGDFCSLFPMQHEEHGPCFTLTDVKHTPVFTSRDYAAIKAYTLTDATLADKRTLMVASFRRFFPTFERRFVYVDYFTSIKCKPLNNSSDRSFRLDATNQGRVVHVFGGKITGALDAQDSLRQYLRQHVRPTTHE
jgi:hypothetical protein